MKVGIIQSNYIPWRGYFDFISEVDLFVFYDDVQYTRRDWRNRNKIKTSYGLQWISVPVKYNSREQLIDETFIDYSVNWRKDHLKGFEMNYIKAPFFRDAITLLENGLSHDNKTISELNIRLIGLICDYLEIKTPCVLSSNYEVNGSKTERLINILNKVNATNYLSGPAAKDYLDEKLFEANDLILEYKTYDYEPYPQLWGEFEGAVSILDLIANCGPEAKNYLTSKKNNTTRK